MLKSKFIFQYKKHGEGNEKFSNGDIYLGNYVNGKPEGYGEYFWVILIFKS